MLNLSTLYYKTKQNSTTYSLFVDLFHYFFYIIALVAATIYAAAIYTAIALTSRSPVNMTLMSPLIRWNPSFRLPSPPPAATLTAPDPNADGGSSAACVRRAPLGACPRSRARAAIGCDAAST